MKRNINLGIIIATKARPDLFSNAIRSILASLDKSGIMQAAVFIGTHGPLKEHIYSDDLTFLQKRPQVILTEYSTLLTPPEIRNSLIKMASRYEWLFFCDDDIETPEELFQNFNDLIQKFPQACVLGGPNLTFKHATENERWQSYFLASRIFNPLFYPRYLPLKEQLSKSTRYYCLRNLFCKNTGDIQFNHTQFCGEELQLLREIQASRTEDWLYSPRLFVYHHRRKSLEQFYEQLNSYGYGRGIYIKKNQRTSLRLILFYLVSFVSRLLGFFTFSSRKMRCLTSYLSGIRRGLSPN